MTHSDLSCLAATELGFLCRRRLVLAAVGAVGVLGPGAAGVAGVQPQQHLHLDLVMVRIP